MTHLTSKGLVNYDFWLYIGHLNVGKTCSRNIYVIILSDFFIQLYYVKKTWCRNVYVIILSEFLLNFITSKINLM